MSDLVPVAQATAQSADAGSYALLIERLRIASTAVGRLSDYANKIGEDVGEVAASVDRLAGIAASLNVDSDTVGEHHEAAVLMRQSREHARSLADAAADLSTLFHRAAENHQADYGRVVEVAQAMPVPMADRTFYANH
ncbi:hypothetical protein [Streptodolium elevatio]